MSISGISVNDSEVDTLIVVLGPSGNPVVGDDDSGTDEDAVIRYRVPEAGVYTVLITHSDEGDTGKFILSRDTFPNHLAIGEQVEIFAVDNDQPGILNLREYPSLGFEILERIPSGSRVNVVNGPYKDRDFVWWQVETDTGQMGWVAEHIGGIQTLFPTIRVGHNAVPNVNELNFRAQPDIASERIYLLYMGQMVSVIDGPVEAGEYTWWKVRVFDGTEGWVVERVDDLRTLVAVVEN